VITRIGLDHCSQLGDTLEAIAAEKAGIIKPGRPVVVGAMPEEARAVVRAAAVACGSMWVDAVEEVNITTGRVALEGSSVRVSTPVRELGLVRLALSGSYQVENLATAVAALETVAAELQLPIDDAAFRTGLERVCWPARFQLAVREPPVVVDGAHNPDGAMALREALRRVKWKGPVALVAGFCDDKDGLGFLQAMASTVRCAWAVPVPSARTRAASDVGCDMRTAGIASVMVEEDIAAALAAAQAWAKAEGGLVLVCGSLFLAGQALLLLQAYPWALPAADAPADLNESLRPERR
jgi:dihydrofolate synthase/folylpolyglutamate synthase